MTTLTRSLDSLVKITSGGAFPYTIEKSVSCEHGSMIIYVLVARFFETDDYDVRLYMPHGTQRGPVYDACWITATRYALTEQRQLERQGKKVTWNLLPKEFDDFPSPPVPSSFCDGKDWGSILNAVLRSRVW